MLGFIDSAQFEFVTNGQPGGPIGDTLANLSSAAGLPMRFDPGLMRPWYDGNGTRYVDIMTGKLVWNEKTKKEEMEREVVPLHRFINNGVLSPVMNASALPHDAWKRIDRAVIRASRERLIAWDDIARANTYGGFDAMAVTGLIRDTVTDPGEATVSMSPSDEGRGDAGTYTPDLLPLPFTHMGFHFDGRQLAQSRNSGAPLDTMMAENAARAVAVGIEKMTIGITDLSSATMGSSTDFTNRGVYGFLTQPDRITRTTNTASSSFDAETMVNDIIAMVQLARNQNFNGPYVLYHSANLDQFLNRDYYVITTSGAAAPSKTVRQRIEMIKGITEVKQLDLLNSTDYTDVFILVQMNSETVRAVNGMDIKTLQWPEKGGLQVNFKVMACHVPDLRSQHVGTSTTRKCGIVHGTTS